MTIFKAKDFASFSPANVFSEGTIVISEKEGPYMSVGGRWLALAMASGSSGPLGAVGSTDPCGVTGAAGSMRAQGPPGMPGPAGRMSEKGDRSDTVQDPRCDVLLDAVHSILHELAGTSDSKRIARALDAVVKLRSGA